MARTLAGKDLDAETLGLVCCVGENRSSAQPWVCLCFSSALLSGSRVFSLSFLPPEVTLNHLWSISEAADGKSFLFIIVIIMSDSLERSTKINLLKEQVVRRLCEVLDKSNNKGWRKLGEIVSNDRRFKVR